MNISLWFNNKIIDYLNISKKIVLLILLIFFSTILEIVGLGSLIPLSFFVIKQKLPFEINAFLGTNYDDLTLAIFFLLLVFFLISLRFVSLIFINYSIQKFLKNISYKLAALLISTYLSSNFFYKSNNHSSLAIKNITSEVELYCKLFFSRITIFSEILIMTLIILILLFFYFKITIGSLIFLIILFLTYQFLIKKKIKSYGSKREYNQKNLTKSLFEIFSNYKLIQIFNQKNFFIKNFNKYQKDFKDINYRIAFLNSLPKNIFEYTFVAALIFFLIINYLFLGKLNESILQVIITFSVTFYRIMPSVSKITLAIQSINFNSVSEKIIIDILDKNQVDLDIEAQKSIDNVCTFENSIKIKNLSFSYFDDASNEKKILNNINFIIDRGSFVGISGPSGSGKTTLMNILMKFEDFDVGEIYVDNADFSKIKKTNWFSKISYVPQSVYIHNDTIKNNIIFGDQKIDEELFNSVLKQSNLMGFKKDQDNQKQEKILSEKGNNISAGQIQRIGIARALYSRPDILFLDEPTSNLDYDNEIKIVDTLKKLTPRITVIMISHRKSSLSKCDKIIQL